MESRLLKQVGFHNLNLMKSLFQKAIKIKHGILESRLVARASDFNRDLTDEETKEEIKYLLETIPYAGLSREDKTQIMAALKYLRKKYC